MGYYCLKTVRMTSWLLLVLIVSFFLTGYLLSGRFQLGIWVDEKSALALHRLLHVPLMVVLLAHSVPASYLAVRRWRRLKR